VEEKMPASAHSARPKLLLNIKIGRPKRRNRVASRLPIKLDASLKIEEIIN